MLTIGEALNLLNEMATEEEKARIITIDVLVESDLDEDLPSGNINDKYDEQTLDDWYDFAETVEGIIDNFCDVVDISLSKNKESISEYISFYSYDENGNRKNYLVNLRLSDHGKTNRGRETRKRKVSKIDPNYMLKSVIINNKQFKSYDEAIQYIRKILAKDLFNS